MFVPDVATTSDNVTALFRSCLENAQGEAIGNAGKGACAAVMLDIERIYVGVADPSAVAKLGASNACAGDLVCSSRGIGALGHLRLTYVPPWPLGVVLDASAMRQYGKLFNWILQVRRAKYVLDRRHHYARRCTARLGLGIRTSAAAWRRGSPDFGASAHEFSVAMARMMYFVNNLNAVLQAAVCESWPTLIRGLRAATSLETICASHKGYLDDTVARCLLPVTDARNGTATLRDVMLKLINCAVDFSCDYVNYLGLGAARTCHGPAQDHPPAGHGPACDGPAVTGPVTGPHIERAARARRDSQRQWLENSRADADVRNECRRAADLMQRRVRKYNDALRIFNALTKERMRRGGLPRDVFAQLMNNYSS